MFHNGQYRLKLLQVFHNYLPNWLNHRDRKVNLKNLSNKMTKNIEKKKHDELVQNIPRGFGYDPTEPRSASPSGWTRTRVKRSGFVGTRYNRKKKSNEPPWFSCWL